MKTAIVYYSAHHENTKKLLDAISAGADVTLIDAAKATDCDLSEYDIVGFASGIYFSKFHRSVIELAKSRLPENKKVFFIYTCGSKKSSYTNAISAAVSEKSAVILGSFGCRGYDTYGPFKLIGGIAKGRPNDEDLAKAREFYNNIIS